MLKVRNTMDGFYNEVFYHGHDPKEFFLARPGDFAVNWMELVIDDETFQFETHDEFEEFLKENLELPEEPPPKKTKTKANAKTKVNKKQGAKNAKEKETKEKVAEPPADETPKTDQGLDPSSPI